VTLPIPIDEKQYSYVSSSSQIIELFFLHYNYRNLPDKFIIYFDAKDNKNILDMKIELANYFNIE